MFKNDIQSCKSGCRVGRGTRPPASELLNNSPRWARPFGGPQREATSSLQKYMNDNNSFRACEFARFLSTAGAEGKKERETETGSLPREGRGV